MKIVVCQLYALGLETPKNYPYITFISKEISILLKLDKQVKEIIRNPQPEKQVKEERKEKGEWKQKKNEGK